MFEESVKVPFLARFPHHFPAGKVASTLVSHYDFMPTLLDYLHLPNPGAGAQDLPGRSFANILCGKKLDWDHSEIVICDEYGPNRMLRTENWKYIQRLADKDGELDELYHLAADPGERHNLARMPQHRQQKCAMQDRLEQWFAKYVYPELDGAKIVDCRGKGQRNRIRPGLSIASQTNRVL